MPSAAAVCALLISEESVTALSTGGGPGGGNMSTSVFIKSSVLISRTWGSQENHFHRRASAEGLERSSCRPRHTNCRD